LIIQMILPSLHRCSHVWLQAEAYFILAKCRMKQAKDCLDPAQVQRQFNLLQATAKELDRSCSLFVRCQDCYRLQEIYYLLAHVHNQLSLLSRVHRSSNRNNVDTDRIKSRDVAAAKHIQYSKIFSTVSDCRYRGSSSIAHDKLRTTAQILSALATRNGIISLANRPLPIS
jgi:hypothetical protein